MVDESYFKILPFYNDDIMLLQILFVDNKKELMLPIICAWPTMETVTY